MRFIPKKLIKLPSYYGQRNTHSSLRTYKLIKMVIKNMSYNEISNIVDSVVSPNKPLSNLEIIAAKKLSLYGFRGVFLRDTLPEKAKLNECGILNIDSSSGDGAHWGMWFKKGKDKFYFDSYGVQPHSELIAYIKSPIFYNSKRVQQNGEVFCGHLCLFALKQFSLGNTLQAVINYLI